MKYSENEVVNKDICVDYNFLYYFPQSIKRVYIYMNIKSLVIVR